MILIKRFSQTKILNTNNPALGFTRGRKYDTDIDRLGRMDTAQRELAKIGDLNMGKEMRKLNKELHSRGGNTWRDTE